MEVYRRLGIAKVIRQAGLPPDHPHDVACRISATGTELSRITLPSPAGRGRAEQGGIGAELSGIPVVQRVQSTYFRAPTLKSLLPGKPVWMYLAFGFPFPQ